MLAAIAITLFASLPEPQVSAPVVLVADLESEEILLTKGSMDERAIASITKLLSIQVVLAAGLRLDDTTEMLKSDWKHTVGGARTRLIPGRAYRNRDLLHAALLGSDNRAVVALGRAVGLSHSAFTVAMNEEAKRLGLLGATFQDVTGISHQNRMAPLGIVALLEAAMSIPTLARISQKQDFETKAYERSGRRLLYRNTNLLVRDDAWTVLVGKTGFNSAAGWCVANLLELKNGRRVAIVVLGADGRHMRFRDARRLAKWASAIPWKPASQPPKTESPP